MIDRIVKYYNQW